MCTRHCVQKDKELVYKKFERMRDTMRPRKSNSNKKNKEDFVAVAVVVNVFVVLEVERNDLAA